ncbi:epoxide hydrolase 1-related [Holotrichia oblita]|uniref:Epoxide hydrolase 1-related n=1 Tax=Holotrichia oblita TaxID=644536 RepID=A0ACB9TY74_HOLOL|nr:epoxide hydrolase 1-related [Holotrichia oblita]
MIFSYKTCILVLAIALSTIYTHRKLTYIPTVPLDENQYWGPGDRPENEDKTIYDFKINISREVISDLQSRIHNARPTTLSLQDVHHQYGVNAELIDDILYFWKTKYTWKKKREKFFNKFPQFITNIQGLNIHFIHEKPNSRIVSQKNLEVVPILLLHGWPGSFMEFYHVIPMLTSSRNKNFVFEVIVPSLPGFAFSDGAAKPGLGASQVAVILHNLMKRIGFSQYYIQGGDWGSIIGGVMSSLYPKSVLGFHSNMCFTMEPLPNLKLLIGSLFPSWIVEKKFEDRVYPLSKIYSRLLEETGYLHIQATKPDTLGVTLNDSPIGLAAYIFEKFISFSDPNLINTKLGNLRSLYGYEILLDNVMIYWVTDSITTSMRLYAETFNPSHFALGWLSQPIEVPTGCTRFKNEIAFQPEWILRHKYLDLVVVKDYPVGGHFAALEMPAILADDIWLIIDAMRKRV